MKVVHLVPAMEQGGVESVVLSLSRLLTRAGHENVVVSRGGKLVAKLEQEGSRHIAQDLKSKNPLSYFARACKLRRLLKAEKPDLVCVHSRVPAWLFVWANRSLRLHFITYAHGANSVSRYSEVMTKGELTIMPSRFIADYLKANYPVPEEKLRVIPLAIDFERFNPAALDEAFVAEKRREWGTEGKRVIMAVGRITQLKSFDELIRAFSKLKDRASKKLVIVGGADKDKEEYLASLKALAHELTAPGEVIFAGAQSRVPECLSLADIVVSSNVRKPEAFGLSMAEALAMGKGVVAKAFGGALDIVRDGIDGVLVKDGDFVAAIERALTLDYSTVSASARERFNESVMLSKTLSAYEEVVR